jgi:hypothetical protein
MQLEMQCHFHLILCQVVAETPLLKVFNLDKLNYNNDPQTGGDGFLILYKVLQSILKMGD